MGVCNIMDDVPYSKNISRVKQGYVIRKTKNNHYLYYGCWTNFWECVEVRNKLERLEFPVFLSVDVVGKHGDDYNSWLLDYLWRVYGL